MTPAGTGRPVVALGGNALLRRGDGDDPAFRSPSKFIGPCTQRPRRATLAIGTDGRCDPTATAGGESFRPPSRARCSSARSSSSSTQVGSSSVPRRRRAGRAGCVWSICLPLEAACLDANLTKIDDGGWLPLATGVGLYRLMMTWSRGPAIVAANRVREEGPLAGSSSSSTRTWSTTTCCTNRS
jgi:hypothetical protein